jgi:signal recognition particle subunit SRP54
VIKIVHEELIETLGQPGRLNLSGPTPRVIMLVGLQGSGKTTTAAKLALMLRQEGRRPFLVAGDTYRPAAVEQLVTLAKQLNIPYHQEGTSAPPPDICVRGLQAAKAADATVVILDTAGRLQIDDDMMQELEAIRDRTQPAEILLVADSMTGQEAVRIAEGFNQRVGVTGLILTKVDGDARGGAAISMRAVTGVPIKFLATGEKITSDTLEVFHPDRLASRILGMGDMLTLIERAEEAFDEEEAERLQRKLLKNQFTLEDFLKQLQQVKRMGSIGQILDMVPGMGRLRQQMNIDNEEAQKQLKKVEAIIYSMTPGERRNPKLLNASRKRRIAAGSGTEVQDINALLKQFREMQRMMKMIGSGRMPKIPGMFK